MELSGASRSRSQQTMVERINCLKNHYILCGAGRTGYHIAVEFVRRQVPFVVIDHSQTTLENLQKKLGQRGVDLLFVRGDGTEDEVLEQAGIQRARGLITAMGDDKDNLFAVLTSRSLNPNLRIVARVNDERLNRSKLEKAGADKVVSTNIIGGLRTASEMVRPDVVEFLDQMVQATEKDKTLRFTELPLTEIKIPELARLIEASQQDDETAYSLRIQDIGRYTGLLVVAVKVPDLDSDDEPDDFLEKRRRYRFTPRGDVILEKDDILVVIGTQDKLDEVRGKR